MNGLGFSREQARASELLHACGRERARDGGGSGGEHRHTVARRGGTAARLWRWNGKLRLLRARRRCGCCGRESAARRHGEGAESAGAARKARAWRGRSGRGHGEARWLGDTVSTGGGGLKRETRDPIVRLKG
jgi:hypothetical protein